MIIKCKIEIDWAIVLLNTTTITITTIIIINIHAPKT